MYFLNNGQLDYALLVLLSVETYARPAEPLRLRVADFVPARKGGSRSLRMASLVLHPLELGRPAKTTSSTRRSSLTSLGTAGWSPP